MWLARFRCSAAMAADAMRARAKQVRQTGSLIGLFEWVAWSVKKKIQVKMLFGSAIVDLRQVFAPDMPLHSRSCLRVGAVRIAADTEHWLSAVGLGGGVLPQINHFVIGVAAIPAAGEATSHDEGAATSYSLSPWAVNAALQVGWMLRETVADGDCGIDCMSYHLGLPRTLKTRVGIRAQLCDFIEAVAEDKAWHDIFETCQEMPEAAVVPATASKGSPTTGPSAGASKPFVGTSGGSSSSSSSGPMAQSSLSPVPPAGPLTSSSPAPPPLPPPDEEPPVDGAAAAVAVAGPRAFREWLTSRSAYQLSELTKSPAKFQAAEAQWRREELKANDAAPIRRRNVANKLNLKYATALSYSKWKAGPGEASRAPLKDSGLVRCPLCLSFRAACT